MAGKLETARVEDHALWDDFVASSPQGSVFSRTPWVTAAAEAQGGTPVFLGVFEDGRLTGGTAFVEMKRGPLRKATAPMLTPYCGFLHSPVPGAKPADAEGGHAVCAEALIEYLIPRYGHIFLVQDPRFTDVREFLWKGFSCPVRYTYVLDIGDPGRLWDSLERRTRKVVRHAEATLTIEETADVSELGRLYEHVYRDRGAPPPISRGFVEKLAGRMLETGSAEMRIVRDGEGQALTAMAFVFDHRSVYALVSGAIPSRNSAGASTLLIWDAMRRHAGARERFDLLGANIRSIAFFKRGFGGALTPYFATERYASPMVRAAMTLYTRMRKVFP